ncbi:MAG: hypothetical protein ACOCV7_02050 [Desulfonatronovibrionaceae bacterium]
MSTIITQDKNIQRAVKWIGEQLEQGQDKKEAIDQAGMRFNLSPKQEQFVMKFFSDPVNCPEPGCKT